LHEAAAEKRKHVHILTNLGSAPFGKAEDITDGKVVEIAERKGLDFFPFWG